MQDFLDAVERNDIFSIQAFIAKGIDINCLDKGGSTGLMRASLHCNVELVNLLLRSGANTNIHDKSGKTALHYAVQSGCEDAIQILLDAKAEVNSQDIYGNSPLNTAVFTSRGKGEIIKLLRRNGADDNLPNKYKVTPLQLAKTIANYDVIQFFK